MSSVWGNKIQVSLFGESHGEAIGATIHGLPPGLTLDHTRIQAEMKRRSPGNTSFSTPRKEKDAYEILSGVFNEKTTGAPLTCIIRNSNTRSEDYSETKYMLRPSHADYTALKRYDGFTDYRGSGHFSGRITAPLVFAGAIAKQILEQSGISVYSHILQVNTVHDDSFESIHYDRAQLDQLDQKDVAMLNNQAILDLKESIVKAKDEKNSLGGIIETGILGMPTGIGSPFFNSIEAQLSKMLFSVPAVKGLEFGTGFQLVNMTGKEANDAYETDGKTITTTSNHNGGILGGISSGMPINFKVVMKPTASIGLKQKSVDITTMTNQDLEVIGRHDPCIALRGVVVIENVTALTMLDICMSEGLFSK